MLHDNVRGLHHERQVSVIEGEQTLLTYSQAYGHLRALATGIELRCCAGGDGEIRDRARLPTLMGHVSPIRRPGLLIRLVQVRVILAAALLQPPTSLSFGL